MCRPYGHAEFPPLLPVLSLSHNVVIPIAVHSAMSLSQVVVALPRPLARFIKATRYCWN